MTQLSGAHAFRRFLRQLSTDFHEILYMTFPSHVLTSITILLMLGHDLEMSCAKFQGNRFRIDGEIDNCVIDVYWFIRTVHQSDGRSVMQSISRSVSQAGIHSVMSD